jgi:hypothetical protein
VTVVLGDWTDWGLPSNTNLNLAVVPGSTVTGNDTMYLSPLRSDSPVFNEVDTLVAGTSEVAWVTLVVPGTVAPEMVAAVSAQVTIHPDNGDDLKVVPYVERSGELQGIAIWTGSRFVGVEARTCTMRKLPDWRSRAVVRE